MPSIRPISHTKFEKFLKKIGCVYKRTSGDHTIYHKEGLNRPIVVPISKYSRKSFQFSPAALYGLSTNIAAACVPVMRVLDKTAGVISHIDAAIAW